MSLKLFKDYTFTIDLLKSKNFALKESQGSTEIAIVIINEDENIDSILFEYDIDSPESYDFSLNKVLVEAITEYEKTITSDDSAEFISLVSSFKELVTENIGGTSYISTLSSYSRKIKELEKQLRDLELEAREFSDSNIVKFKDELDTSLYMNKDFQFGSFKYRVVDVVFFNPFKENVDRHLNMLKGYEDKGFFSVEDQYIKPFYVLHKLTSTGQLKSRDNSKFEYISENEMIEIASNS